MLVIPDQSLEYPDLEQRSGRMPDNVQVADCSLSRGLIRSFPLYTRQMRSSNRYVVDEGFAAEQRINRVNIEHRGGRAYFNGSTSYIDLMVPHHIREDNERFLFTISVRVRPERQNQTEYILGGNTGYINIRLLNGVPQFLRQAQAVLCGGTDALAAGVDHIITVIYDKYLVIDGVTAEWIYVDGELVGTGTNTTSFSWFSVPIVLGRLASGSTSSQFQGLIDNVLIWNRPLTAGEIAALSRRPLSVYRAI